MPFKSEKQRKYLWANEPEIAKDWTEEYGSTPVKKRAVVQFKQQLSQEDLT